MVRAGPAELGANNFDFLRFCLATLVILSHSFALTRGSEQTEPLSVLTRGQTNSGELAVHGFFVISGFLVTHSWVRGRGVLDFARKRLSRIYPGYAVALLFCAVVVVSLADGGSSVPFDRAWAGRVLRGLVTLRGIEYPGLFPLNPSHALNGSLWSIKYEAWCYVGLLVLGLAGALRRPAFLLAIFPATLAVSVAFRATGWNPGWGRLELFLGPPWGWARLLPYFLAGMLFYTFRDRIEYTRSYVALAFGLLTVAVFVPFGLTALMPVAGSYLLFAAAFSPTLRLHGWARPGDFSYGIYLYAYPLQQLIVQRMGTIHPLALFALATPAAVLFGAASWHGVERWFLRRTRKPSPPAPASVESAPAAS